VDELRKWAAERAPELIARAEAEAVAVLRDALVEAAGVQRRPAPEPPRRPGRPVARSEPAPGSVSVPGELVWAYCVVPADAPPPGDLTGVDPESAVERLVVGPLAALVSRVPRSEFGPEPLRRNLNDLDWLARTARAHEAVLEHALACGPLVPLRLCTLYEDRDGVERMLESERELLTKALESVAGRQEWGVKLRVDPQRLAQQARDSSPEAAVMAAELEGTSEAAAYMLRRRLDRHVREVAGALAHDVAADVTARLEQLGCEFVTRPPQNRELSQHEGEMLLNAACFVDDAALARLHELAAQIEDAYEELGAQVDVSGPWPPYNFVAAGDVASLA
jgi:Gas vesicle synthesis protein GvpL/GvpF